MASRRAARWSCCPQCSIMACTSGRHVSALTTASASVLRLSVAIVWMPCVARPGRAGEGGTGQHGAFVLVQSGLQTGVADGDSHTYSVGAREGQCLEVQMQGATAIAVCSAALHPSGGW